MVLPDELKQQVSEILADLKKDVTVVVKMPKQVPEELRETAIGLMEDIKEATEGRVKYRIEEYSEGFETNEGIVFHPEGYEKAAFLGIPFGLEFRTLLELILLAGNAVELPQVKCPEKNLEILVFVTPTCPYCPHAAMEALKLAYKCPGIKARVIEATQWPLFATSEEVSAVPRYVIRDEKGRNLDTWEGYGGLEYTMERLYRV